MEEKELTKIFLKTLISFYYGRMVASTPSDFNEMVGMCICLEEVVQEGHLTKDEGSSCSTKKPSYGYGKKKKGDTNYVSHGRSNRSRGRSHRHQ